MSYAPTPTSHSMASIRSLAGINCADEPACSIAGANEVARRTGATVISNGTVVQLLREAGVPERQLCPVSGGERVPLFTAEQRRKAGEDAGTSGLLPPAGVPGLPNPELAPISLHVWPSCHCFNLPGDPSQMPEEIDSGARYTGSGSHDSTLDMTRSMQSGLGRMVAAPSLPANLPDRTRILLEWFRESPMHLCSFFDGGHLMFNILVGDKALLWASQLGGYEGILKTLEPKPDVLIQGIFGRANLNGRPFGGSSAEFVRDVVKWVGEPAAVIYCQHDKHPFPAPNSVDTTAATELLHKETGTRVIDLEVGHLFRLFT